jgi:hypothetical protein
MVRKLNVIGERYQDKSVCFGEARVPEQVKQSAKNCLGSISAKILSVPWKLIIVEEHRSERHRIHRRGE